MTAIPTNEQQQAVNENTPPEKLSQLAKESIELARLVAKNISADPELLRKLASSSDKAIRQGVAANPNTPTDVLLKLGAEFPELFLSNPVLPLVLLEDLNLVEQMSLTTLRRVLKQPNVPVYFLEKAAETSVEEIPMAVVMNERTPKEALGKLLQSSFPQVALSAKLHVNWAGEMTDGWEEAASSAIIQVIHPANMYGSSLEFYGRIGILPDFLVKDWIEKKLQNHCLNPPVDHLESWLIGLKPETLSTILYRTLNTPVRVLEILAKHRKTIVLDLVALHPNTPVRVLEELAQHPNDMTRAKVAQNPNAPCKLLTKLALDEVIEVRASVAKHLKTSSGVLEKLMREDKSRTVRENAAINLR